MKVLYTFLKQARGLVTVAVIAAALSGVSSTAVIALISSLINGEIPSSRLVVWAFVGLCVLVVLSQLISEFLLLRLSEGTVFDMRLAISRRILATPLRRLEELGAHRLLATITDDIRSVAQAVTLCPLVFMYTAVIVACFGYMAWLDWRLFLITFVIFIALLSIYQMASNQGEKFFTRAREDNDTLYSALRGLSEGTKELKLNLARRQAFLDELLEAPAAAVRSYNVAGHTTYRLAGIFGRIAFLIIFGLLLFVVPSFLVVDRRVLSGFIIALLYMNMPLTGLLNVLSTFGAARVALRKIDSLGLALTAAEPVAERALLPASSGWSSLRLERVTHTYYREAEDEKFTLGPVDFSLSPGELVFVVGGNGSGKTTLAKLLVGLYLPEGGKIRLDGKEVPPEALDSYRQLFSMVFSDFYLFEKLLGFADPALDEKARDYIVKLHLDRKVKVDGGHLSTTSLSQGQRKRLALLNAFLEDRPIYVFDEWAADQDPIFKEIFYHQLLPDLKMRGKTVVVISHDDHYYHVADRLVKLNYGLIEPYEASGGKALPAPKTAAM